MTKSMFVPGVAAVFAGLSFFLWDKTGGCLNFARLFALCMMSGNFEYFWVYLVAGVVGGTLGGLFGNLFLNNKPEEYKKRVEENRKKRTVINR